MSSVLPCTCAENMYKSGVGSTELPFHLERQDTDSQAWKRLLDLVEKAARDKREEFAPLREISEEEQGKIITLPSTIANLKSVKRLILYGSSLVYLPPEIGEMESLKEFTPYTSYSLHWFPYEITRCRALKDSTVSTRALYGNYKYRPPFPRLPNLIEHLTPPVCSVCRGPFPESGPLQYWISLRVATDVLPLLVHACSEDCVSQLPKPSENYIPYPHLGGTKQTQPPVH